MVKKFVYLVQSADHMPYENLPGPESDIILLTWKKPADFQGAVHCPGSSWNEGRNRLLQEALHRADRDGEDYLYYIFLDDDCLIQEDGDFARQMGACLTGNPFRTFERFLLEWEPAVGYTRYDWQHFVPQQVVNGGYNFDAIFNAFHREALSLLLPYYTGYDAESWLYSQLLINHLTAVFYNPYRLQFNAVTTANRRLKGYSCRKKYWSIPTTFLVNAFKSGWVERINRQRPNDPAPFINEAPRKKDRSYALSPQELERHFDTAHPLFRYRKLNGHRPCPTEPAPQRPLRTAVCISGSCRSLDQTARSIKDNLLARLFHYDLFMFVPEDEHCHLAWLLEPTVLEVAPDQPIDEAGLAHGTNCRLKTGVQSYLQQLYGLKRCNSLRCKYEEQHHLQYDCVIRCRPDLMFLSPLQRIEALDLGYLYVPDFHHFDGLNDRFALGRPAYMSRYMNKYDDFHQYAMDWGKKDGSALPVSAEMFTSGQLKQYNIPVRSLPIRFNRVRAYGTIQDTAPLN